MITSRLNLLVFILIVGIALSSIALNYNLVYNNKKSHIEHEINAHLKRLLANLTTQMNLSTLLTQESYASDVPLFAAFVDAQGQIVAHHLFPHTLNITHTLETFNGLTRLIEEEEHLFAMANTSSTTPLYVIVGVSKASLRDSIFAQTLYVSLWVGALLALFFLFLLYYTRMKIERPLRSLFDSNLKEFVNGILSASTQCDRLHTIEESNLPKDIQNRILNTFGMLQKWSCFKIHFDEFLKMTVAESNKKELVANLYTAIEGDFFVKSMTLFETNHSLNRFEPLYAGQSSLETLTHDEALLAEPSACLAYRTGNRVLLDESRKKSACSMCHAMPHETIMCKPMMSGGKHTGVLKLVLDNEKIEASSELNGDLEAKIRFLESYLNAYVDLTSLTISNINLLNAYKNQALTDPLTNLYNRRYITEYLFGLLNISKRKQAPLSIFMIDIDNFKKFNDEYGHKVGDAVLKIVSKTIQQSLREGDTVARYGGEEFIAVLPYSDTDTAYEVAERVRGAVERIEWNEHQLPNIYPVTISVGISAYPIHGYSHYHLTNVADKALYRAKREGRNKVIIHEIKEREADEIFG